MNNTLTMATLTRWNGAICTRGTVFRVPEDVDLETAQRWVRKGIAKVGGEFVSAAKTADEEESPFAELEEELNEEKEDRVAELAKRSKEGLLEIASSRLIQVNPKSTKEEIARILIETPE